MAPPEPKRPRQGSSDALDRLLDEQPERGAVRHSAVDGVPQAPPRRPATRPEMAALRAPPIISQPDPPLPGPAPLPVEHARTVPAAAHVARTQRAPTPVDAQAARSETPSSGRPSASLPPPSRNPDDGAHQAQRRELERLQAERDRAQAELQLERLRAEERAAERELELQGRLAEQQGELELAKIAAKSKPWIDERLVKALASVLTAMAALGVPLGIWLTAKAGELERAQERQAEKSKDTAATAGSAKVEASGTDKRVDELEKQLAAERAYNRGIWKLQGIEVPKRPGDPDPPKIDAETPLRKPGTVTKGPVLVVKTPPP